MPETKTENDHGENWDVSCPPPLGNHFVKFEAWELANAEKWEKILQCARERVTKLRLPDALSPVFRPSMQR